MRYAQYTLEPDGYFEYDGETITYYVRDDGRPVRMVHGVEKMSGFFNFTCNGVDLGTIAFNENYEDMTPVSNEIAMKYYMKLRKIKS